VRVSESAVVKVLQALIAEVGRGRDVPDLASVGSMSSPRTRRPGR